MIGAGNSSGLVRKVALVSAAVVALLAATFAFTIWENSKAHARAHGERADAVQKQQASVAADILLAQEQVDGTNICFDRDPALLVEAAGGEVAAFTRETNGLGSDNPREASLARAGQSRVNAEAPRCVRPCPGRPSDSQHRGPELG